MQNASYPSNKPLPQSYRQLFRLVLTLSWGLSAALLLLALGAIVAPGLQTLILAELLSGLGQGGLGQSAVHWGLNFLALFLLLAYEILQPTIIKYLTVFLKQKVERDFYLPLLGQLFRLPYADWEDPEALDRITRLRERAVEKACLALTAPIKLLCSLGPLLAVALLVSLEVWYLGLLLFLLIGVLAYFTWRVGQHIYEASKEADYFWRRRQYFWGLLTGREEAAGRILNEASEAFLADWEEAAEGWRKKIHQSRRSWLRFTSRTAIFACGVLLLIVFALLFPLQRGALSLAMFVALTGRVVQMVPTITWTLPSQMEELASVGAYCRELGQVEGELSVFRQKSQGADRQPEAQRSQLLSVQSIECRDLCFRYPHQAEPVLRGLNLRLEAGRRYALVGANGSGKTTLVKLLLGLYPLEAGQILVNERGLEDWNEAERRELFEPLFQDFAHYQLSARENVFFGAADPSDEGQTEQLHEWFGAYSLGQSLELAGGIDKEIGKIYAEGLELSGGQWQSLAFSRSLAQAAPILILDEPTASLDPLAERELYASWAKLPTADIVLLITHRLGSVQFCDEILVLDQGHIVEQGRFEELMARGGLFAQMYQEQRKYYED